MSRCAPWLFAALALLAARGTPARAAEPDAPKPAQPDKPDKPDKPAKPDSDDDVIIIDDGEPGGPGRARSPSKNGDGEIIIIEDPNEGPREATPPVTGALGRLWETWHVAADSSLFGGVQLVEPEDGPWRLLGSLWLESTLLPEPNLSIYADGFGRVAVDGTPDGKLVPILDLYEAYAKIDVEKAAVSLGRIVVPWGRTQAAALGDRLNPPDFRRGPQYPDPARQKQPEWGGTVRTSLGSVGIEGVAFAQYEESEGSLAASNQGGVRIARYQTALVRSPARAGGLLSEDDTHFLDDKYALGASATLAGRAWRRVGDVDISGSVVWGYDETPRLHLRPDVARALASELLVLRPGSSDDTPLSCRDTSLSCVGGPGTISHERTTSFSLDASWGLGIVILRAEAVAYPHAGLLGGRSAIVVDDLGLRSATVSQYAGAFAVEGALGDGFGGSLELFDVVWDGVPAGALLWGVEPFSEADHAAQAGAGGHQVHRVAAAASLAGAFVDDRLRWRLRGEAGVLQPDVLMSAELRYQLPVFGLYVGGRTDLFTGVAGSPGWFRQDASLVGVFVGEGS